MLGNKVKLMNGKDCMKRAIGMSLRNYEQCYQCNCICHLRCRGDLFDCHWRAMSQPEGRIPPRPSGNKWILLAYVLSYVVSIATRTSSETVREGHFRNEPAVALTLAWSLRIGQ